MFGVVFRRGPYRRKTRGSWKLPFATVCTCVCACRVALAAVLPSRPQQPKPPGRKRAERRIHSAERQRTGTKDEPPAQRSSKKRDLYHLLCREGGSDSGDQKQLREREVRTVPRPPSRPATVYRYWGLPGRTVFEIVKRERKKKSNLNIAASSSIPSLYGELGFGPSSAFIRGDYEGRPVAAAGRSLSSLLPPHRRVIDKRGSTLRRKWAGFATRAAAARVCRSATTTPLTRGRAYLRI